MTSVPSEAQPVFSTPEDSAGTPPLTVIHGEDRKLDIESLPPGAAFWAPFVEAYARQLRADPEGALPFDEVAFYMTGLSDKLGAEKGRELLECFASHPDAAVQNVAAGFMERVLSDEDQERVFRVSRKLFEDDNVALEAFKTIEANEDVISAVGLKKALDALSTRWWEREQGYHQQVQEIRADLQITSA
jgi:hypothetical protein